ncbi:helix-turn-helix domain-containing protein, partial [Pseudarthrobacter sp. MDT3-26]|uniref:helix-turn-helix domain-containing protein n=1 Tax=Pseudarthrobacter raffinosi TaxID=2953651 RepID=UPI00208ECEDF
NPQTHSSRWPCSASAVPNQCSRAEINPRKSQESRKKTLTPERAAELVQRASSGVPKALLARDYGISRETVYQYLRHAKLD